MRGARGGEAVFTRQDEEVVAPRDENLRNPPKRMRS